MEEKAQRDWWHAAGKDIAILCGGDPLMATTHKILLIEAKKQKVEIEVVHATSILTAAMGESGLDFYRFGRYAPSRDGASTTGQYPSTRRYTRTSANNLHTLLLLDYDSKQRRRIEHKGGITILKRRRRTTRKG